MGDETRDTAPDERKRQLGECAECGDTGWLGTKSMCETCEENFDLCAGCRGITEDQMRAELALVGDLAFCWLHVPIRADDPGRAVLEERDAEEARS